MTSCAGNANGMKKKDNNDYLSESTRNIHTEIALSCATADAKHLVVKITHSVPGLFNEMMICTLFISVNTIHKFLRHELILVNHGYDQLMSKVDLHLPGL